MSAETVKCVLLANRHDGLTEGIRQLLKSEFTAVVMVADETSLLETAVRIKPSVVLADLGLGQGESFGWLGRLRVRCPDLPVIVLSVHDELCVLTAAFEAGASGFLIKRNIATDLKDALSAVLAGKRYPAVQGQPGENRKPQSLITNR